MTTPTARETVETIKAGIGSAGAKYMLHPETLEFGTQAGYPNGYAWYVTGRGGVLGDCGADVVAAAFGFFGPDLVAKMWQAGTAVEPPRAAGARYAAACAEFGRRRLDGAEGLDRFNDLAERVLAAADPSGLSLFAALRGEPTPPDAPGRAYWNLALMREWRGSAHVLAVRAAGLTPGQAIVADNADPETGREQALKRGFGQGFDEPADLADRKAQAEGITSEMQAPAFEALSGDERAEFISLVAALTGAVIAAA